MEKSDCDKSAGCEEPHLNRSRSFKSKQLVRSQAIRETQSPPRTVSPGTATLNNVDVITDNINNDNDSVIADNDKVITDDHTAIAENDNEYTVINKNDNDYTVIAENGNVIADNDNVIADADKVIADNDKVITDEVTADNDDGTRTLETSSRNSDDSCSNVISVSDVNVSDNYNSDVKKLPVEIQITSGAWEVEISREQRQRARRWLGGHGNSSESSRDLLSNLPRTACVCGHCAACPHCKGRRRRACTKQDSGIACSEDCPDCGDTEPTGGTNNTVSQSNSLDVEEQPYYCRCPERKEKPKTISLSRTDSDGLYEPTGVDLVNFIKETLNKNSRDRLALLRIEKELHALVSDFGRSLVRFPVMSSYSRLLVHRAAALFQLNHHLDPQHKTCVLVSKTGTSGGRIPCTSFKEWCTVNFPPSPQRLIADSTNAKSILKRARLAAEQGGGAGGGANASRSLEQRERDYERVRRRIFSTDNCPPDEAQWPWLGSGPVRVLAPEGGRNKLLKVQSLEGSGVRSRGAVSKSHSFGGYSAEPPHPPPHPPHPPRLLSRQGDLASSSWRLSPSSSGYKTLSLRSTDSVTPSPTGGASPEPSVGGGPNGSGGPAVAPGLGPGVAPETGAVVWAVTDMAAVPPGAVVIHPQTGRPLTNPDGSVYYFDPQNPPIIYDANVYMQNDIKQQTEPYDQKRRGRLEKQHSFIDNECDCQPQEEYRGKCCCDYRRQDGGGVDKETNKTPSPQTYEKPQEPTNQSSETAEYDQVFEQNCPINDEQKKDTQEMYPQFVQGIRADDVGSPQAQAQDALAHDKMAANMADAHLRQMPLTNVMYAPQIQQFPYINQCRIEAPLQQVYQQMMPQLVEDQKTLHQTQHTNENTFRIDPSYPYAALEYAASCGACVDNSLHTHRSYNMQYEAPAAPGGPAPPPVPLAPLAPIAPLAPYPMGNIIMPQLHPYQEQLQWANMQQQVNVGVVGGVVGGGVGGVGKLYLPELVQYPLMQYPPPPYQQYNVLYPQMIPQHYSICQPYYPVVEKQPDNRNIQTQARQYKRNSATNSARNTPHIEVNDKPQYVEKERPSEIALKIQQIKEQMAQMNMRQDRDRYRKTEDYRRRNSGNGILGNYPVNNHFNNRVSGRGTNEDPQLTSAARAIVDSIRNMQHNTYHDNRRSFDHQRFDQRQDRPERRRHDARDDRKHDTSEDALHYRQPYLFRQMSPGTWCRRSPGPVHPVMNQPRRPHPDTRNGRR